MLCRDLAILLVFLLLPVHSEFICTYSTSPQFLAMRSVNPYRQQMLTSDLELSCAVITCNSDRDPSTLFVRAHQNISGTVCMCAFPALFRALWSTCAVHVIWRLLMGFKLFC